MADKKRRKRNKDEPEKPTKEEYAVAQYLRFNVPTKDAKLMNMPVKCFTASKAIDCLLDSKWATNKGKTEALFTTRYSCVDYCNRLLIKGIFHRAYRQEKSKEKKKKKDGEKTDEKSDKQKEKKSKKKDVKKEEEKTSKDENKDDKKSDEETKETEKKVEKKDEEKKKKKERKYKLEMHETQKFVDGDDIYVWIYDPVPLKNKIIGLFLVLGAIGVCLFPLWPPEVRLGVYYLSLAAAGFVGFILVLCIVRVIVFGIVWGLTFGKHHLWIFPNLTEDVGIIDSFKPLYQHEMMTKSDSKPDTDADKAVTASSKNNTEESEPNTESKSREKGKSTAQKHGGEGDAEKESLLKKDGGVEDEEEEKDKGSGSSEAEGDSGQDESNGYEMVQHEEVETHKT